MGKAARAIAASSAIGRAALERVTAKNTFISTSSIVMSPPDPSYSTIVDGYLAQPDASALVTVRIVGVAPGKPGAAAAGSRATLTNRGNQADIPILQGT